MKKRERNYLDLKERMKKKGTDHRLYFIWCFRYKDIFDNWRNPLTKRKLKKKNKKVERNIKIKACKNER